MPRNAALVTALILERPLCLECIASKSGLQLDEAERVLTVIARALSLRRDESERCRACGRTDVAFSLGRPKV